MRTNTLLWIAQGLLAALFLFAGVMKLIIPIQAMTMPVQLPGPFIKFIGVAEMLGAVGLILPGLLRIRTGLTPLAAAGLVIIMAGAVVITVLGGGTASALFPLVVGLLAGTVAYVRWRRPIIENRATADPVAGGRAERAESRGVQQGPAAGAPLRH